MQIFPTDDETTSTTEKLVNTYAVPRQLLGKLFRDDQRDRTNALLQALGCQTLSSIDLARLLIEREGPQLFAGSTDEKRELRRHLIGQLSDVATRALFENHGPPDSLISVVARMRQPLADKPWHSGKRWAKDFVQALGLPAIFAGIASEGDQPDCYDIAPMKLPPDLVDYQVQLKNGMLEVLNRDGDKTRCVVTLPTGGGKTRVAVEAFIEWMKPRFASQRYLVWITQSEELCEQAISCIDQMWRSRDFVASLRVYRYFGSRKISADDLAGGVVVASIQQLHSRIESDEPELVEILSNTGAMIIDEAHRASSMMYDKLLNRAEELVGKELFPICGLTATPGSGVGSTTEKLVGRFDANLIKPHVGADYEKNPIKYFRDKKFLARAKHVVYKSQREYELTDQDLDEMKRDHDLPKGFLKQLAVDDVRNELIIRRLLVIPEGTPTLLYACSVEHAYFLSVILTEQGRRASAVSAKTPPTLRRALISEFKEGRIEFLCNFGVLTTGFDAPKTGCIAICRPTTSEVLYEQIVGRGLRGERFGGTEECTIIDFADNISRLGQPQAYERFSDWWISQTEEKSSS